MYEFISDILFWTNKRGCASVGHPARTDIYQLCVDSGCSLEDQPGIMDNRDGCRERIKKLCAVSMT